MTNKQTNCLPPGYKEGIERVTNIVSFVYPFSGTDGERRYLEWLKKHSISPEEYIKGAQEMGTQVHNALEHYILSGKNQKLPDETKLEYEAGKKWLDKLGYREIETEKYVCETHNRFQGAVDLLYTDKYGKTVLADWKSYGIVKKRFGLPNKFIVATDKKKKVRLQMSIYCYALAQAGINVDRIELLFLHEEGIKVVTLDRMTDNEIEVILFAYENRENASLFINLENMDDIKAPLVVKIQTAPVAYSAVSVELDIGKLGTGQTAKEALNELIATHKKLHDAYLPKKEK